MNHRSPYGVVVLCFALGLMAKPMVVTLPLVLLLIDYWPLGRPLRQAQDGRRLLWEKAPLLAMAAVSSVLTVMAQQKGGALSTFEIVPFALRLQNAAVAYVSYIGKMLWPTGLAAHYPYPKSYPAWQVIASVAILLGITAVATRLRRSRPYLFVGWLWFLITLVPVIGLVQVGGQSFADRYTYVPLVGLFVMVAWGVPDLAGGSAGASPSRGLLAVGAVGVCLILAVLTSNQVRVWNDGITLWRHAVAVTRDNCRAHYNLGALLQEDERINEAIPHYVKAIEGEPRFQDACYNLARCLEIRGDSEEAIKYYQAAIKLKPDDAQAHTYLGCLLGKMGKLDDMIYHCSLAAKFKPDYAEAHLGLALAFFLKKRYKDSLREAQRCAQCRGSVPPGLVEAIERKLAQERR